MLQKFGLIIRNGSWVYRLFFKISPFYTILMFFSSVSTTILPILGSFYTGKFIDALLNLTQTGVKDISELELISPVVIIIIASTAISTMSNMGRRTEQWLANKFRNYFLRKYEYAIHKKISSLDIQQFEDPNISNSIQKAWENFYKVQEFARESLNFVSMLLSVTMSGYFAFKTSPFISAVIVLFSLPGNIIHSKFIKEIWDYYNNRIEENRFVRRLGWYLGDDRYAYEHKISGANNYLYNELKKSGEHMLNMEQKIYDKNFIQGFLLLILNAFSYLAATAFLLQKVLKGEYSVGDFTFYQGQFKSFSGNLDYTIGEFLNLYDLASYLDHVRKIESLAPLIINGDQKLKSKTQTPPKIELKNVSFKYPNSKKYVLKNINITINPFDEIAIVGENGAGKSTLIKLLLRFHDPQKGEILIDDIPIKNIDIKDYYKRIGVLNQEYNKYHSLSVKENILLGDPDRKVDLDQVKTAAKKADAHEFIVDLENKYDQKLDKTFSKGTDLSGGQWQKIAISRMFYRDAPILILDEPTASIDAQAEHKIFKNIYHSFDRKTVIIISHRFSTVRNAHRIYVLEDGEIVEQGNHEDLTKHNGIYKKAFSLQAKGYSLEGTG